MTKYKNFIVWLLIGLCFIVFLMRHLDRSSRRGTDFQVYYATAQRFIERGDIYGRPDETITPFKYSPMFAFLIMPLTFFPQKTAGAIFFTMSFISLLIVLIYSKKLIVHHEISFKQSCWLYVLPVILSFRFVLGVFDSGQASLLMIVLVALGLYCFEKEKNILGGAFFALSMMFKYMPFIFIPYFLIKRKFKAVLLSAVFALFYCFLPAVYSGWGKEKDYLAHWLPSISQTSLDKGSWTDYKNQSFYSLILRYFMKDSPYEHITHNLSVWPFHQTLIISLVISALIYLLMVFPKTGMSHPNAIEYSLLFIGMALFNPNAWTFNYVSLIFVYMMLVYYFLKNGFANKWLTAAILIAFILTSGGSQSLVGEKFQYQCELFSTLTMGVLILLFILYGFKFKKESA